MIKFNDGVLTVWKVTAGKDDVGQPVQILTKYKDFYFDKLDSGMKEYYLARQAGINISFRARIPQDTAIPTGWIITVNGGDERYRIGRTFNGPFTPKGSNSEIMITDMSLEITEERYAYQ